MKNRQLLVMAHGSRNDAANQSVATLTNELRQLGLAYDRIDYCFLELARPSLTTAVEQSIANDCQQIDIYPLFFSPGNHVLRDVPKLIKQAQENFPDCRFTQLDFFGNNPMLSGMLAADIDRQAIATSRGQATVAIAS